MLVGYLLLFVSLSVFLGSTGLGLYLYYFAEVCKKVDFMPLVAMSIVSGWMTLFFGAAIAEEESARTRKFEPKKEEEKRD